MLKNTLLLVNSTIFNKNQIIIRIKNYIKSNFLLLLFSI